MKLNHNDSSLNMRNLGKYYFRKMLLNCDSQVPFGMLELDSYALSFLLHCYYHVPPGNLVIFSLFSLGLMINAQKVRMPPVLPLPNLISIHLDLTLLVSCFTDCAYVPCTVPWNPSPIVSALYYILCTKFCSFLCVPLSRLMTPPFSSCPLSHCH